MASSPRIYVGPTVGRLGLHYGQIYRGALPQHVRDAIKQCPPAGDLIVPVEQAATARQECGRRGSWLHGRYAAVLAQISR